MGEITSTIAWCLYRAILQWQLELTENGPHETWLEWIQSIRLAKMDLMREFRFDG